MFEAVATLSDEPRREQLEKEEFDELLSIDPLRHRRKSYN